MPLFATNFTVFFPTFAVSFVVGFLTFILILTAFLLYLTVIVAVPFFPALITPFLFTEAIFLLLDLYVARFVTFFLLYFAVICALLFA